MSTAVTVGMRPMARVPRSSPVAGRRRSLGAGAIGCGDAGSGFRQEGGPRGGQLDPTAAAGEELHPDLPLQGLDLMAQRGLDDVAARRSRVKLRSSSTAST